MTHEKEIKKQKFYWIKPIQSKKWHIHNGDGRSLCGNWLMTNTQEPVSELSPVDGEIDCKICVRKFKKLIEGA